MYSVNLIGTDAGSNTETITITITVDNTNDNAPVFADGATDTVSVNEGGTTVGSYDLTDADTTDPLASSGCTDGGADAGDFTPTRTDGDTCTIAFTTAPNFESPADADTDNSYTVTLTGTDAGSNADTITITEDWSVVVSIGHGDG